MRMLGSTLPIDKFDGLYRRLLFRWIVRTLGDYIKSVITEIRHRHAVRQMERLDDRTLADLGLRRGDIDYTARHGRRQIRRRRDQNCTAPA